MMAKRIESRFNSFYAFIFMFALIVFGLLIYLALLISGVTNFPIRLLLTALLSVPLTHLLFKLAKAIRKGFYSGRDASASERKPDLIDYIVRRNTGMNVSIAFLDLVSWTLQRVFNVHARFEESEYYTELVANVSVSWMVLLACFFRELYLR